MKFGSNFITVGTTVSEAGCAQGVVIQIGGLGSITLNESGSRKLADDILRNANYLWPIQEDEDEKAA